MPSYNANAGTYFLARLTELARRLGAVERQQNHGCTDATGKLRLRWGLQPDGTFGMWALDPTTGAAVMKLDGSSLELLSSAGAKLIDLTDAGLAVYDSAGHELVKLDDTGQTVYDTSGNVRADLGALSGTYTGEYGLLVRDSLGNEQALLPTVDDYVDSKITVTSTSYVTDGGPSVTVPVGPSGKVLLEAACYVDTLGTDMTAWGGLYVDTSFRNTILTLSSTTGRVSGNVSTKRSITTLSQATHKFELRYKVSNSAGATFGARSLIVTPV